MPKRNLSPSLLFVSLLALLPFVLFWRWLLRGKVLFWGTPLFQFWPWHQLVKEAIWAGHLPLWNPLLGNGTPLLANLQSALFYPPNLLYLLLPVAHALTLSVILHLGLAGVLMFAYARHIRLSPFAATIAALSYMFSGYIVGRAQFVPMINALAWFPLLLLLTERLATRRDRRTTLWLGLVLALQLLAGHAQLWFYGLWLIGPYVLFRSWQQARATNQPVGSHLLWNGLGLAGAVGLALLLSAAQLLPTAELVSQSPRTAGAERTFALTYSFWPWRLITLLAPNFFGSPAQGNYWGYATYWEDHAYLGTLPFLLALSAIWQFLKSKIQNPKSAKGVQSEIQNPVVPFFAPLIPLSLILAMGWNTPVYLWVFDHIPGFSYFQAPSRLLIWYTLAMAILAGVGANAFHLTPRRVWTLRLLLAGSLGMAATSQLVRLWLAGLNPTFLSATTQTGLLLALAMGLLLACPRVSEPDTPLIQQPRRDRWWQTAVLVFIAVDLLWTAGPLVPLIPARLFEQPIRSAQFLQMQPGQYRYYVDENFDYRLKFDRYFRFEQFGPPTVEHWQAFRETLLPNLGVFAGLPSANNDDPLVVARRQRLVDHLKRAGPEERATLLALMNIRYLIDAPTAVTWPVLYQTDEIAIQQVPDPLPRAYFVSDTTIVSDEAAFFERLAAPDFDSRREVVIIRSPDLVATETFQPSPDSLAAGETAPVTLTTQGPNQLRLRLEAPTAGWVVLTDTFYPGWQATSAGQPVEIWPANLAFRAVRVAAGPQEIIFRYRPLSVRIGLWMSGGSLLITILYHIILTRNDS